MPTDRLKLVTDAYYRGPGLFEADRSFFNDYWARYGSSDLNADFVAWVAEGLPVDE